MGERVSTNRLELRPLPVNAGSALVDDRERAARDLGARLDADWPQPALLGIVTRHTALAPEDLVWGIWTIVDCSDNTVVGDIGFHGPPSEAGVVEIGYSVVPGRRRRGYATEAVQALVAWALRREPVKSIVAGCDPDNQASIKTLERSGFTQTGVSGGELRWALG